MFDPSSSIVLATPQNYIVVFPAHSTLCRIFHDRLLNVTGFRVNSEFFKLHFNGINYKLIFLFLTRFLFTFPFFSRVRHCPKKMVVTVIYLYFTGLKNFDFQIGNRLIDLEMETIFVKNK